MILQVRFRPHSERFETIEKINGELISISEKLRRENE